MALQLFVPVTGSVDGGWFWLSLVMVPIVMALIRYEHKPTLRRLLAGALVALVLAVALAAEDDVVIPTFCESCHMTERYSAAWWACWLAGCF